MKAIECYLIAAKNGCFRSQYESSCLIFMLKLEDKYLIAFDNLIYSYILGYMFPVDDFEFILFKMKIKI